MRIASRRLLVSAGVIALIVGLGVPWAIGASATPGTYSLFGTTPTITAQVDSDNRQVELGVRVRSTVDGTVDAVRFLKAESEVPTHQVSVWSSGGKRLASAVSSHETPSGWQQVSLNSPLRISAGKSYVISYNTHRYMASTNFFKDRVSSGPLRAPARTNGVFAYGASSFPRQTYQAANYWVDVVFSTAETTSSPPPSPTTTTTVEPTTTTTVSAPTSVTTSTTPMTTTTMTSPPVPTRFPGAQTTGWRHTGVTLKKVPSQATSGAGWHVENNTFYVTQAGAVIDGLDINMCVKILANHVSISRSRIGCASYYAINTSDPPVHYKNLKLIDVELDGLNNTAAQSIAVMGTEDAQYIRLDVHGMASSGPRLASGNILQDSYLHDFVCAPPDHSAGVSANDGGRDIVVRHNNIDITNNGCASAAWEIAKDFGTYDNILTEGNLFNGGAYCAYAGINVPNNSYGQATNIKFVGNVFGRNYSASCGLFGPIAQWAIAGGSVWSGNTWGDGAAATGAHRVGDPVVP